MNNKYHKILILQTAYIGDVIVSTPLVREIKKLYPAADVDIITTPLSAEIFQYNPYIRKVIKFDKRNQKYFNLLKLIKYLRGRKYECSISIQSSLTSALLLYFSGIARRIGFKRQVLTTDSVEIEEKPEIHRSENILKLLTPLSNKEFDHRTELFLSDKERQLATNILEKVDNEQLKLIGIAPGSIRFTKQWPESYYVELLKNLASKNVFAFLIGGPKENKLCQRIINKSGNTKTSNLAGELSILESSAVIKKLDLMLTNDSAPLHMANAVKTDVFAFFGPTIRKYGFFPYRKNDKIFEIDLYCRSCSLHGGKKCPEGHFKCMLEIRPGEVYEAIEKRLKL